METYITVRIAHSTLQRERLEDFFKAVEESDNDAMRASCRRFDVDTGASLSKLLDNATLAAYLSCAEVRYFPKKIHLSASCGSLGDEFLVQLMHVIGPNCSGIRATYEHDEDRPEDDEWPVRYEFIDGNLLINGQRQGSTSYQEPAFEKVGPHLDAGELAQLRSVCAALLETEQAPLKASLETFQAACHILIGLEDKHHSGKKMHANNIAAFRDLYARHAALLEQSKILPYLCTYYRHVILRISTEHELGTCILRFDEAYFLTWMLIDLIDEDDGAADIFADVAETQEEFYAWKDLMVLMVEIDESGDTGEL